MTYEVKDSGERMEFESGMVRDTDDSKTDYSLVLDGPMFKRWAEHLTKGAKKYAPRNWMLASGQAEYLRFKTSALRHFLQWFWGDTDEDHASAVFFNINGAEYVKALLSAEQEVQEAPDPPLYELAGDWSAYGFPHDGLTLLREETASGPVGEGSWPRWWRRRG